MNKPRTTTLAALAAATILSALALASSAQASTTVACVAHRGGPTDHTEQTSPTYSAAVTDGAATLDGDIRWSATGFPYMLHNADMGLFGHGSVDLADISGTTAVSYLSGSGDHIMSLYELRTLALANPGVHLELELKTVPTAAQWAMLATRLDDVRDVTTVTSFNEDTVRAAQDHGYRTAYLIETATTSTAAPVVDQLSTTITSAEVSKLNDVGVQVEAWTPNTVAEWNTLAAEGVTIINTDDPVACASWSAGR